MSPCVSNFLEESSSLSHSVVFLHFFALVTGEGFLISPCYSLELCIQMETSFLFSLGPGNWVPLPGQKFVQSYPCPETPYKIPGTMRLREIPGWWTHWCVGTWSTQRVMEILSPSPRTYHKHFFIWLFNHSFYNILAIIKYSAFLHLVSHSSTYQTWGRVGETLKFAYCAWSLSRVQVFATSWATSH